MSIYHVPDNDHIELICECRDCQHCNGQGRVPTLIDWAPESWPGAWPGGPDGASFAVLETEECAKCGGSGKDSSNCEIPQHWNVALSAADITTMEDEMERARR